MKKSMANLLALTEKKKTIGIIGGMGPLATADLFRKIVLLTRADTDSEHIHIFVDNYPQIPDRTSAILEGSDRPLAYILESARWLEKAGADFLLIPCSTSHSYYEKIVAGTRLPVLNMLKATASSLQREGVKEIGLLATDGTIKTNVFAKAFASCGIETICPGPYDQKKVMDMIYQEIKAGRAIHLKPIFEVMDRLHARGAERIVLGCTELPIAFEGKFTEDMVDPTRILAIKAIQEAGYPCVAQK